MNVRNRIAHIVVAAALVLMALARPGSGQEPTGGTYMGQQWLINPANHVIYWNGAPYVPIGFRDAGIEFKWRPGGGLDVPRSVEASKRRIDDMMKEGFNTFGGLKSGGGIDFVHNAKENSLSTADYYELMDQVLAYLQSKNGYYITSFPLFLINADGSWKDTLGKEDTIRYVNRQIVDVSSHAGKTSSLKVSRKPHNGSGPFDSPNLVLFGAQAYLFDYEQNTMRDVSSRISACRLEEKRRVFAEGKKAYELTAELDDVQFPDSQKIKLVVIWQVGYYTIDVNGEGWMPGLWKSGIIRTAKASLNEVLPHIKRENLRGIVIFGGEEDLCGIYLVCPAREREILNGRPLSGEPTQEQLAQHEHYPDYRAEPDVLVEYRRWLQDRFGNDIAKFNKVAETSFSDFASINWVVPLRPNNSTKDPDFQKLFGLFHSAESEGKIDELQSAFHHHFYGKWVAEYGRIAKETVGNVPTFTYATDLYGQRFDNSQGLDIHESALLHGIDGVGLSLYENAFQLCGNGPGSWFNRVGLIDRFRSVEKQTGKTKFMWVFEGAPHDFGKGYGERDWEGWYDALIRRGVKGFIINSSIGSANYAYTSRLRARIMEQSLTTMSMESNPQGCYLSPRTLEKSPERTELESPGTGERREDQQARNLKLTKNDLRRIIESDSRVKTLTSHYPGYEMEMAFAPAWRVWRIEIHAQGKRVASASVRDQDGKVVEFAESE